MKQYHRFVKKRTKLMLGIKNFHAAQRTIGGIESIRMIQKGQIHGFDKKLSTFHNFVNLMEKTAQKQEGGPLHRKNDTHQNRCDRAMFFSIYDRNVFSFRN